MPDALAATLRTVPDFPKPGISFKDITPLLADPALFREAVEQLRLPFAGAGVTHVVGVEARGFWFGAALAERLEAGFVPARKPGKLPAATLRERYALEYGTDALEIHADALRPGHRVLLHDDVIATGGTAAAAARLVGRTGAEVAGFSFLVELAFLGGRSRLPGDVPFRAVLRVG
ncbi:MAG TPA: adenine phosphoribosyltransferase [Anaeromyxobacteraceae bacterium]|nr:adenine phosphoribosyltransferase [Anaeromyxobacteraceae bacterium]